MSFFHLGGFICYNHIGTSVINWHLLHYIIVSCHRRWCSYLPCPGPILCPWTSSSAHWDISQQLLRAISTVWRAKTCHTINLFFQDGICAWSVWNSHSPKLQMEPAGHRSHPYHRSLHPTKISVCLIYYNDFWEFPGYDLFCVSCCVCVSKTPQRHYSGYKNSVINHSITQRLDLNKSCRSTFISWEEKPVQMASMLCGCAE